MEHDGIFVRPLPEDVLDHFDEVLRLDCFQWYEDVYNTNVEQSLSEPIDYFRRDYDEEYYCTGGYYIGAYGYAIKPAGARKLVEFSQQRGAVCTEAMLGSKIVDVVSTTATVIRIHKHYIGQDIKYSTTYNLGLYKPGRNSLVNPIYITPSKYKQLYQN
jgi:GR25 family glycosyltransferase involved in LPS biosynthesis